MNFSDLRYLIYSDSYRYSASCDLKSFFYSEPGFRFSLCWRFCSYFVKKKWPLKFIYYMSKPIYNYYKYKFGIDIPIGLSIGPGFFIGHFGGIVIGNEVEIGKNCNISHGVTIGRTNRGRKKGSPKIGDNCYIAPGAKIIGKIAIGNNVAIGANCVITKDVPDNCVIAGVPGKIISHRGSEGYINRIDY